MFYRIRLALKEESEIKEQGRQETYQKMSDWNSRRLEAEARAVFAAFCVFSSYYSHERNSEKNKLRCSTAQPRRGEMSIEALSLVKLSPVGAICLLCKNCPNRTYAVRLFSCALWFVVAQ